MTTLPPFLQVTEAHSFYETDLHCPQESNLCFSKKHRGLYNLNEARKVTEKLTQEGNSTNSVGSNNYFTSKKHLLNTGLSEIKFIKV